MLSAKRVKPRINFKLTHSWAIQSKPITAYLIFEFLEGVWGAIRSLCTCNLFESAAAFPFHRSHQTIESIVT